MPGGVLGFGSNILQGKQRRAEPAVAGFSGNVGIRTPAFGLQTSRIGESLQTDLTRLTDPGDNPFARRVPGFLGDLSGVQTGLGGLIGDLRTLRGGGLGGAISQFRAAGLQALEGARQAASSNLSQSLARRNVLGSSFGQDALSRVGAEFGQRAAEFEADVGLQQIGLERDIIGQEAGIFGQQAQTVQQRADIVLQENNALIQRMLVDLQELGIASGLPISVQKLLNANSALKVQAILGDEAGELARNKLTQSVAKDIAKGIAASSQQFKIDHGEMNSDELLEAIESMPIHRWEYKQHIGPWAEDFADRFGGDGVVLKLLDMIGIQFGAIKALTARVKALETG